ncbi:MAG TPA: sulfite exporter TauE/SafE family protein [Bacteroidia bacterium]|nr:sulfite exporter TauE/SafE family protein [Bacteroidia bacterium]
MNTIYILLLIGLIAGFFSGLIGIGGGVIIVPLLVYALNMNQINAQGTTLFMFLMPIGILGVYNYYKAGQIDYKSGAIMAITFLVGSYFGSKTAVSIDTKIIKQIFGLFMVLIGIKLLLNK